MVNCSWINRQSYIPGSTNLKEQIYETDGGFRDRMGKLSQPQIEILSFTGDDPRAWHVV